MQLRRARLPRSSPLDPPRLFGKACVVRYIVPLRNTVTTFDNRFVVFFGF